MTSFRFHTRVPVPAQQVWETLTQVELIPTWFPGVEKAVFDGTHRVLTLGDGSTLRARVVTVDHTLRRFQYRFVDGMSRPIDFHLGTLDVIADDGIQDGTDGGAADGTANGGAADGAGSLVVYSQEIEPAELGAEVGPAVQGGIHGIRRLFGG